MRASKKACQQHYLTICEWAHVLHVGCLSAFLDTVGFNSCRWRRSGWEWRFLPKKEGVSWARSLPGISWRSGFCRGWVTNHKDWRSDAALQRRFLCYSQNYTLLHRSKWPQENAMRQLKVILAYLKDLWYYWPRIWSYYKSWWKTTYICRIWEISSFCHHIHSLTR